MNPLPLRRAGAWTTTAALAALAALVVLAGCNNQPQQIDASTGAPRELANSTPLVAQANSPVVDLPVPMHFKFMESRSRAQIAGGVRYVSHYYKGRQSKEMVARFYREQMIANHRWQIESFRNDQGTLRLDFVKGAERCNITITENWWTGTVVHAEIYHFGTSSS